MNLIIPSGYYLPFCFNLLGGFISHSETRRIGVFLSAIDEEVKSELIITLQAQYSRTIDKEKAKQIKFKRLCVSNARSEKHINQNLRRKILLLCFNYLNLRIVRKIK